MNRCIERIRIYHIQRSTIIGYRSLTHSSHHRWQTGKNLKCVWNDLSLQGWLQEGSSKGSSFPDLTTTAIVHAVAVTIQRQKSVKEAIISAAAVVINPSSTQTETSIIIKQTSDLSAATQPANEESSWVDSLAKPHYVVVIDNLGLEEIVRVLPIELVLLELVSSPLYYLALVEQYRYEI